MIILILLRNPFIKVFIEMEKEMVTENLLWLMEIYMKGNLEMITIMEKVFINGKMELSILENLNLYFK